MCRNEQDGSQENIEQADVEQDAHEEADVEQEEEQLGTNGGTRQP